MNLDIETTVKTLFFMLLVAGAALLLVALRSFREASRLRFFLKRRALLGRAWQFIFFSLIIVVLAFVINSYAEPVTYKIFQPSPTITQTPTITLTPTITQTPTVTNTATVTPTLEFTVTPQMPVVISQDFTSQVTPNPNAVFSSLSFSRRLTGEYQPIDPAISFANPVEKIFASFSYNNMSVGTQWTALWFRDGELVYYESKPWNGASGGYGYSDCVIPAENWLPGNYEVQMFVGETWKVTGRFSITGEPPTPTVTPSLTPTFTLTPTLSPTVTRTATITPTGTKTLLPSATLPPTATSTRTKTAAPSATSTKTPQPSQTSAPTKTTAPTDTPVPSQTPTPSRTPTVSLTPSATIIPTATRRSTIYR